jgi:hypothetical protein
MYVGKYFTAKGEFDQVFIPKAIFETLLFEQKFLSLLSQFMIMSFSRYFQIPLDACDAKHRI